MTRKIAWKDLPAWVKTALKEAGPFSQIQIIRESGSLSFSEGVARYNGIEVAPEGVAVPEDEPEEVIRETELPGWALMKMRSTPAGCQVQRQTNGNMLQILANGVVFYNGKRIIRSASVSVAREEKKPAPPRREKTDPLDRSQEALPHITLPAEEWHEMVLAAIAWADAAPEQERPSREALAKKLAVFHTTHVFLPEVFTTHEIVVQVSKIGAKKAE